MVLEAPPKIAGAAERIMRPLQADDDASAVGRSRLGNRVIESRSVIQYRRRDGPSSCRMRDGFPAFRCSRGARGKVPFSGTLPHLGMASCFMGYGMLGRQRLCVPLAVSAGVRYEACYFTCVFSCHICSMMQCDGLTPIAKPV